MGPFFCSSNPGVAKWQGHYLFNTSSMNIKQPCPSNEEMACQWSITLSPGRAQLRTKCLRALQRAAPAVGMNLKLRLVVKS